MPSHPVTEGEADFHVPGVDKPCKTWYEIHGNLTPGSGTCPLVLLHGGPGIPSNYLIPITDLASTHGIPTIRYDQLGCGKSTHLPEKMGDASFWTADLFVAELDNLLAHLGIQDRYCALGQSWGGMLLAEHAVRQPAGLQKAVIANSPADMKTWVEVADALRRELPQEVQDTLKKHEREGTTESREYEEATFVYYQKHVCRVNPWPKDLSDALGEVKVDPTVTLTMNGPSEFFVTGSLKDWTITDKLHKISVPTLLINGRYDEAQDACVAPYFREIPKVKWVRFAESSHMPQYEETELYKKVVGDFLTAE